MTKLHIFYNNTLAWRLNLAINFLCNLYFVSCHVGFIYYQGLNPFSKKDYMMKKITKGGLFYPILNKPRFFSTSGREKVPFLRCYYSTSKSPSKKIWISSDVFFKRSLDKFVESIYYNTGIRRNTNYNILLKLKQKDTYYMLGKKQLNFNFVDLDDITFHTLFERIIDLILSTLSEYESLEHSFEAVLLDF